MGAQKAQTAIWYSSEGDAWHQRNHRKNGQPDDRIIPVLKELGIKPTNVFEVGCGDGWRLRSLRSAFGCSTLGCDVSRFAVAANEPERALLREARNLSGVKTNGYDMVIYGFCLYACDPRDLLKIAAEGDRILQEGGHLVIYDFAPDQPHTRKYAHDHRLKTTKMQYGGLWLGNPVYQMVDQRRFPHEEGEELSEDTAVAVTVLKKLPIDKAFPLKD